MSIPARARKRRSEDILPNIRERIRSDIEDTAKSRKVLKDIEKSRKTRSLQERKKSTNRPVKKVKKTRFSAYY